MDKLEIKDLTKFYNLLKEVSTIPEPIKGIKKLEEIPIHFLEDKEKENWDIRYLKFKLFLDILNCFSQNYNKIKSLEKKINNLPDLEKFEEISVKKQRVEAKLSKKEDIVFDADVREDFLKYSAELWNSYVAAYHQEHKKVSGLRGDFGKDILNSNAFKLLEELSKLELKGIVKSSTIREEINSIQIKECDFKVSKEMIDPEKIEGISCTKCEYKLGSREFIERELTTKSEQLQRTIRGAIGNYFIKLLEIDAGIMALPISKETKYLEKFVEFLRENKDVDTIVSDKEKVVNVIGLLTKLTKIINEYISRPPPEPEPEPIKVITLEEFTNGFIQYVKSQGMKDVPVSDFERYLEEWMVELKEKYGENCEIKII